MNNRKMYLEGEALSFVKEINKEVARAAPIRRKSINVPGRPGAIPNGFDTDPRPIKVTVEIEAESKEDWLDKAEILAGFVIREEPVELEFESEPGRYYKAEFEGELDTRELNIYGQIDLNFICNDPHSYKREVAFNFVDGAASVAIGGTVPSKPIYEIDVLEDITHLDIFTNEHYLRFGKLAPIDEPVYERQTLVMTDNLTTLNGWSLATTVDNGYIAGAMQATPAGFVASNFGTAITPHKWQGPSVQKPLTQALQNFRIDIPIVLLNNAKNTGMIEVYLKDAQGNTVMKIGLEDIWYTMKRNQGKFQLGNVATRKVQHYRVPDYAPAWNDFRGMLRLYRDGNRFRPYFSIIDTKGKHNWVSSAYVYTDIAGEYLAPITSIQVAIRKFPGSGQADMRIDSIKVWRLNDPKAGVPIMAQKGQKIIIDSGAGVVLVDGEEREDLKDWFSDYFAIKPGSTTLLIQPADKVAGKIRIRERSR